MTDQEIAFIGAFVATLILLVFLFASIRTVHEGEMLAIYRLGRAWKVAGPGLAVVIPLIDRTVRVAVPVELVNLGDLKGLHRVGASTNEVPGYPGISFSDVAFRAAILARQGNAKTRRATAQHFQEALRALAPKEGWRA